MSRLRSLLDRCLHRIQPEVLERGQTLVEYGMIVALLAIVSVAILMVVGQDVTNLFTSVSSQFKRIDSQTP
jgi:Flp pilus assembly pilin Flp